MITFLSKLGWRGLVVAALGLVAMLAGAKSELMAQANADRYALRDGSIDASYYESTETGYTQASISGYQSIQNSQGGASFAGASVYYDALDWSTSTETYLWSSGEIPGNDVAVAPGLGNGRVGSSLPGTLTHWNLADGSFDELPVTILFDVTLSRTPGGQIYNEMSMYSTSYPQVGYQSRSRYNATSSWENTGSMGISISDGTSLVELIPEGTTPTSSTLRSNKSSSMTISR